MVDTRMDTLATEIGALLKLERERADLTQRVLAARVGVDQPRVSRVERGHGRPHLRTVERIFAGLGLRLRCTVEPTWQRVDAETDRLAALSPDERLEESGIALVLEDLGDLPCVIEGLAAAVLHGVPVPAKQLALAVHREDLSRFAAWLDRPGTLRWDERWQDFGYRQRDPRVPGPMRWSTHVGEVGIRVVERLPTAVGVAVAGRVHRVRPLWEIEVEDPRSAEVISRVKRRKAASPGLRDG